MWVTLVLQVGGDAVGVDHGQLAEGCFPALELGSFDELAGGLAVHALGGAGFLGALSGSFVLDVADRQPEQLDRGGVVGEVAAVKLLWLAIRNIEDKRA